MCLYLNRSLLRAPCRAAGHGCDQGREILSCLQEAGKRTRGIHVQERRAAPPAAPGRREGHAAYMAALLPQTSLQLHLRRSVSVTSQTTVAWPQTLRWCYLRHGSSGTSDTAAALPQTSPCRYPRRCGRHLGATSHTVLVSPPSPPGCCCRHGGNITSAATTDMAATSPQVLPQTWRRGYLSQPFSSALPGPFSPGETGTNHLHPPGSLQPATAFGGSGGVPRPASPPTLGADTSRQGIGTLQTLPSPRRCPWPGEAARRASAPRHLADAP